MVPYSTKSTELLLKKIPTKFVSPETAIDLAKAAYHRALSLHFQSQVSQTTEKAVLTELVPTSIQKVIGVGCTAAITTDRERKGLNHAYIAIYSGEGHRSYQLIMEKGKRDRAEEEAMVSAVIIRAISDIVLDREKYQLEYEEYFQYVQSLLFQGEEIVISELVKEDFFKDPTLSCALYYTSNPVDQNATRVEISDTVQALFANPNPTTTILIYSGSYNPIHDGHYGLLNVAERIIREKYNRKCLPLFDIGIQNADKNQLDETTVRERMNKFYDPNPTAILLSKEPLFLGKAKLFPGAWFLIGVDTAIRLIDKKYYGDSESKLIQALAQFYSLGTKFMVGGRFMNDKFVTLGQVTIPNGFEDMFIEISEEEFRIDISSTEIRNKQNV